MDLVRGRLKVTDPNPTALTLTLTLARLGCRVDLVRVRGRANPNPNPSPSRNRNRNRNRNPNPDQYGYDSWMDLTSKKARGEAAEQSADPSSGIMDLMKQMYDEGDDTMKKTIGEAMLKSRKGEGDKPGPIGSDMGFGGGLDMKDF